MKQIDSLQIKQGSQRLASLPQLSWSSYWILKPGDGDEDPSAAVEMSD